VIRTALRYHRPASTDEACAILAEHHGNVRVLAGGTQLLPLMHRDEVRIEHVVDPRDLGLSAIRPDGDRVQVGAMATYADVLASELVGQGSPLLARAAAGVTGGRQILLQGTLVGAACFNFPSSDFPGVLVAVDARFRIQGPSGNREVPASVFLRDAFVVDLEPGEFVTSFTALGGAAGYCKLKHSSGSWPIATASAQPNAGTGGWKITLGAVEAVPTVVEIRSKDEVDELVRAAVEHPWSDVLAPGWYRAEIANVAAHRAIVDLERSLA
jgi:aerobic carbon-monoxide dehydrogenase medium subunit